MGVHTIARSNIEERGRGSVFERERVSDKNSTDYKYKMTGKKFRNQRNASNNEVVVGAVEKVKRG